MATSTENMVLALVTKGGILSPRDFQKKGASTRLPLATLQKNKLVKVGRRMYGLPSVNLTEHQTFIQAAQRVPQVLSVCFQLSAIDIIKRKVQTQTFKADVPAADFVTQLITLQ